MRQLLPLLLPKDRIKLTQSQEDLLKKSAWINTACQLNLGPAFCVFLRQGEAWGLLPSQNQELLEQEYRKNMARLVAWESVLAEILSLLKPTGHVPVLLKGLAFASELYPDPAARCVGDIDIMIDPGLQEEVKRRFLAAGFQWLQHGARPPGKATSALRWLKRNCGMLPGAQSPDKVKDEGETVFLTHMAGEDVLIEVHYHLINLKAGGGKEKIFHSRNWGWPNLRTLHLAFGEVGVLDYPDAFLHALRHLALHHRLIGFRWHHDLALMLAQWGDHLKPDDIREQCRAWNSEKILCVELAILQDLFGERIFPDGMKQKWQFNSLPWEYPLYRHVARGGKRTPWRELVRTFLAPSLRQQLQTLT